MCRDATKFIFFNIFFIVKYPIPIYGRFLQRVAKDFEKFMTASPNSYHLQHFIQTSQPGSISCRAMSVIAMFCLLSVSVFAGIARMNWPYHVLQKRVFPQVWLRSLNPWEQLNVEGSARSIVWPS